MWARHLQSASDAPQRSLYLLRQAWRLQSPLESLGQAQGASCSSLHEQKRVQELELRKELLLYFSYCKHL